MVILDDADVEAASKVPCGAVLQRRATVRFTERIYVAEPLFEPFTRASSCANAGDPPRQAFDFEHDMGSWINHGQLERVSAHVEDARANGATVPTGGRRREDFVRAVLRAHHLDSA